MNEKEELKKAVIESCINGAMTIKVATQRLGFSERYVKKLKARYKEFGTSSILHGNCGILYMIDYVPNSDCIILLLPNRLMNSLKYLFQNLTKNLLFLLKMLNLLLWKC